MHGNVLTSLPSMLLADAMPAGILSRKGVVERPNVGKTWKAWLKAGSAQSPFFCLFWIIKGQAKLAGDWSFTGFTLV